MPSELDKDTHSLLGEDLPSFSVMEDSSRANASEKAACRSDLEAEAFEGKDAFFNDSRAHVYRRQKEQPKHRLLAYMIASGKSNHEVARLLDMSYQWVLDVQREPWVRLRIQEEMRVAGRDNLQTLLVGAAEDSVYTLIEMRDSEAAKPAERISAANSLLNRLLGNPTQPIAHSHNVDPSKMSDEDLSKFLVQNDTNTRTA